MKLIRLKIKKILVSIGILVAVLFFFIIYQFGLFIIEYTDVTASLNNYEKGLVSQIEKYSQESINEEKNLEIRLWDLTKGKSFDRVEIIGCYDINWNERIKLNKKLFNEVDKKLVSLDDYFMTMLLINKNEVVVLKLNRRIGDFTDIRQSCKEYKKCNLKFSPKQESWNGEKYTHQYITISDKH